MYTNHTGTALTPRERIFLLMSAKGVNQSQFAEDIGVATSSVSDWRKGKGTSFYEHMNTIARYFKVSMELLYEGSYEDLAPHLDRLAAKSRGEEILATHAELKNRIDKAKLGLINTIRQAPLSLEQTQVIRHFVESVLVTPLHADQVALIEIYISKIIQ